MLGQPSDDEAYLGESTLAKLREFRVATVEVRDPRDLVYEAIMVGTQEIRPSVITILLEKIKRVEEETNWTREEVQIDNCHALDYNYMREENPMEISGRYVDYVRHIKIDGDKNTYLAVYLRKKVTKFDAEMIRKQGIRNFDNVFTRFYRLAPEFNEQVAQAFDLE